MQWQLLTPIVLIIILGILFFIWWKNFLRSNTDAVTFFFFVCNAQDYFEGLVWDLRRISNWREKEICIYVTDLGSSDDTMHIIKVLEENGFVQQLNERQAARFLRTNSGINSWIFNLKEDTEVKEIRKCFVRIFTEQVQPPKRQRELF